MALINWVIADNGKKIDRACYCMHYQLATGPFMGFVLARASASDEDLAQCLKIATDLGYGGMRVFFLNPSLSGSPSVNQMLDRDIVFSDQYGQCSMVVWGCNPFADLNPELMLKKTWPHLVTATNEDGSVMLNWNGFLSRRSMGPIERIRQVR
jgi:hypothetical protein